MADFNMQPDPAMGPQPDNSYANDTVQPQQTATQPQPVQPKPVVGQGVETSPTKTPAGPPNAGNAQPAEAPQGHNIFRSLMETLAGPKFEYRIKPDGTQEAIRVPQSKSTLANSIVAGALTGLFQGAQERGPGASVRAFGAGGQANMQRLQDNDKQARQTAQADFARKAGVAEANMRTLIQAHQLSRMDAEDHDTAVASMAPVIEGVKDLNPAFIGKEHVSEDDAKDMKTWPIDQWHRAIDGKEPIEDANGKVTGWKNTYTMLRNDSKVPLTDADGKKANWLQEALDNNSPLVPQALYGKDISPSTPPISAYTAAKIAMENTGITSLQKELNTFHDKNGWDKVSVKDTLKNDPSMAEAIFQFQRASGGVSPSRPDIQLQKMLNDPKAAKFAPQIEKLFGDKIEQFKKDMVNKDAADKTAANETARVAAESAAKAKTPEGQLELQQKQQQLKNETQELSNKRLEAQDKNLNIQKKKNDLALENQLSTGVTGQVIDGVNTQYLESLPEGIKDTVRAIGEGRQGFSPQILRTAKGQQIAEALNRAYPGYDITRADAYAKARNEFTGAGQTAKGINALNTALNHLGNVSSHITYTGTLPGVANVARAFGNENATSLNTDKHAVADEIGKAYKLGVVSESERDAWLGLLDTGSAPELRGNVKELAKLLNGKFDALQHQWEQAAPPAAVRAVQFLSPHAKEAYQRVTGDQLPEAETTTPNQQQRDARQQTQQSQPQQPTHEQPVYDPNGKLLGYTQDGQHFSRKAPQ